MAFKIKSMLRARYTKEYTSSLLHSFIRVVDEAFEVEVNLHWFRVTSGSLSFRLPTANGGHFRFGGFSELF